MNKNIHYLAAISLLAGSSAVYAQDQANKQIDKEIEKDNTEVIIVTGVARDTRKIDATFSINTITPADIQKLAPHGAAELLGNIPGFFPEGGTAGESHNNVLVRGLTAGRWLSLCSKP